MPLLEAMSFAKAGEDSLLVSGLNKEGAEGFSGEVVISTGGLGGAIGEAKGSTPASSCISTALSLNFFAASSLALMIRASL